VCPLFQGNISVCGKKKAILKRIKEKTFALERITQYNINIKTKARFTKGLKTKVKKIVQLSLTTYRKEKADGGEIGSVDVPLPSFRWL